MPDTDLVHRVEKLEQAVQCLRDLPERTGRLELGMSNAQVQPRELRIEKRCESSELRSDIASSRAELRQSLADARRDLFATLLEVGTRIQVQLEDLRRVIVTRK
jgi:hypothetical protein